MSEQPSVAERIRDEREWTGYSRAHVAQVLNVTEEDVAAFEGGIQLPTEEQLERLRKLFGLAPGRLQGEPLAAEPTAGMILCGGGDLTAEDRYCVMRFSEYLRHAGPAPGVHGGSGEPQEGSHG